MAEKIFNLPTGRAKTPEEAASGVFYLLKYILFTSQSQLYPDAKFHLHTAEWFCLR